VFFHQIIFFHQNFDLLTLSPLQLDLYGMFHTKERTIPFLILKLRIEMVKNILLFQYLFIDLTLKNVTDSITFLNYKKKINKINMTIHMKL